MAALNLAGKTSGYIKLKSPDVALNATVELPNKDGILATLDDIGSGGGSGGGDYTPEALVWEDKLSERALGIKYTNTNNVPLYVQIYTHADAPGKNAQMWIDGIFFGATGNSSGDTKVLNTNLYIIPAGSTYELRPGTATPDLHTWNEARMPLAVASGGSTLESLGIPNHDKVTVDANGNAVFGGDIKITDGAQSLELLVKDGQLDIGTPEEKALVFNTNNTERIRVTHDGKVGIGTNNPTEGQLVVRNDNGDAKINIKVNSSNGANGIPALDFSVGGQGPNDPQARIHAVGRDNYSADIVFSTQMNGTVNPLEERMRIGYDGHTTMRSLGATGEGYVGNFNLTTSNDGAFSTLLLQRDSSIGGLIEFKSKGNNVGSISTNGTTCILDGFTTRASDVYFSDDEDNPRQGKSLKETLADRDKLIDKLVAKVEALEAKLKKVK
jgi:hypothetical protein